MIPYISSPDHLKIIDPVKRRWAPLLAFNVLILLALVIILLCVLVRKRFHRSSSPAGGPEVPPSKRFKGSQSKEVILNFLCCKNEARVEPASDSTPESHLKPSPAEEEEEDENVQGRGRKIIYKTSRVLYTIEEEREETASYGSRTFIEEEEGRSKEEVTSFSTSCASPPFCTPPKADGNTMARTRGDGMRSTLVSFSF